MHSNLELAALSPTLQLCLQSTDRCNGLIRQPVVRTYYVPYKFHPKEAGTMHAVESVDALVAMGLLARNASFDNMVSATDDGIELLNTGHLRHQVSA